MQPIKFTVKVAYRPHPWFWQSRVEAAIIVVHLRNMVPNTTDIASAMEWFGGKWVIGCDLHQWNLKYTKVKDIEFTSSLDHETFRKVFRNTLGNSSFDGEVLTPEKAISRLAGHTPWKKGTFKSLGIL